MRARAKPLVDPALWIGEDDYPPAAHRAEQAGQVGLLLLVGTDGRVSGCTVLASSGSKLLDAQTCKLLTRRARFTPAVAKDRRPAADRWNYSIEWKLRLDLVRRDSGTYCIDCGWGAEFTEVLWPRDARPRGEPELWVRSGDYPRRLRKQAVVTDIELAIASDGRVTACRVTGSSGSRDWDWTLCSILRHRARFEPARNAKGKRVPGKWSRRYYPPGT